jgi:hypothetical protein
MASSSLKDNQTAPPTHLGPSHSRIDGVEDVHSVQKGDLLDLESIDPVLNAKMRLVNDAIDEIGFTGYQAKLFVLSGFGYVDAVFLSVLERTWQFWQRRTRDNTWWLWTRLADTIACAGYMLCACLRELPLSFHFKVAAGTVQLVIFADVA